MLEMIAAVLIGKFIYDRLEGIYYEIKYRIHKRNGGLDYEDLLDYDCTCSNHSGVSTEKLTVNDLKTKD